jgi:hypothetical protein
LIHQEMNVIDERRLVDTLHNVHNILHTGHITHIFNTLDCCKIVVAIIPIIQETHIVIVKE